MADSTSRVANGQTDLNHNPDDSFQATASLHNGEHIFKLSSPQPTNFDFSISIKEAAAESADVFRCQGGFTSPTQSTEGALAITADQRSSISTGATHDKIDQGAVRSDAFLPEGSPSQAESQCVVQSGNSDTILQPVITTKPVPTTVPVVSPEGIKTNLPKMDFRKPVPDGVLKVMTQAEKEEYCKWVHKHKPRYIVMESESCCSAELHCINMLHRLLTAMENQLTEADQERLGASKLFDICGLDRFEDFMCEASANDEERALAWKRLKKAQGLADDHGPHEDGLERCSYRAHSFLDMLNDKNENNPPLRLVLVDGVSCFR